MTYILYNAMGQHAHFLCARDRVQPPLPDYGSAGPLHKQKNYTKQGDAPQETKAN